jgi:hypothetical protein
MGLLIWLALAVAYGCSVWNLKRQERYGCPLKLSQDTGGVLPLWHRYLPRRTSNEDNAARPINQRLGSTGTL